MPKLSGSAAEAFPKIAMTGALADVERDKIVPAVW
jgi:hypothetical protein